MYLRQLGRRELALEGEWHLLLQCARNARNGISGAVNEIVFTQKFPLLLLTYTYIKYT
jgi:hypothetical protein